MIDLFSITAEFFGSTGSFQLGRTLRPERGYLETVYGGRLGKRSKSLRPQFGQNYDVN